MSSSDLAMSVRGISKRYSIRHDLYQHSTAAEAVVDRLKHPFRRQRREDLWALGDVSFDVPRGEVLGIFGRNGAGKSTLLKIIARITNPTSGEIDLYGKVGSLLEVGTGFHPELTGRENIYLNGSILGMRRRDIDRHFDEIVAFAGTERFLDTPMKRYSSGMWVRLAFAVAAHLDADILLVDEVLAVGDVDFQSRCLAKMREVASSGRTVLFVSHQMQSVSALCTSALYLEAGGVAHVGTVEETIDRYMASFDRSASVPAADKPAAGTGELRIVDAHPAKAFFAVSEEKQILFTIEPVMPLEERYYVFCHLLDSSGAIITICDSRLLGIWIDPSRRYEGTLTLRHPWLKPGTYTASLLIVGNAVIDRHTCRFEVSPLLPYPAASSYENESYGFVFADFAFDSADESAAVPSGADRVRWSTG